MTEPPTLGEALASITACIEHRELANWYAGDRMAFVLDHFGGPNPTRQQRAVLVGACAEAGRCSREAVLQRVRVAKAFPEETRALDVPWSVHRYLQQRFGGDAPAKLREALDAGCDTLAAVKQRFGGGPAVEDVLAKAQAAVRRVMATEARGAFVAWLLETYPAVAER